MSIGYVAALQQYGPVETVALSTYAEANGFSGVSATDSFAPWVPAQGHSSFVWAVLPVIAEHTRGTFGPSFSTPGFRWHPAMVAQASATLAAQYPGRHWLGIGPGEALHEHVVGGRWPDAAERIERMFESIEIIKKLFVASIAGHDVRHSGRFYSIESTRLWTMPADPPRIFVLANGPLTARRAGRVADGLFVLEAPLDKVANIVSRFDEGAREVGKAPASGGKSLQLHLSWAPTESEALRNALVEWPNGGMRFPKANVRSPYEFEELAAHVRPSDFSGRVFVSADPEAHRAHIQSFADLGFGQVFLHNVGRNQREWIDVFGRDVIPKLVA